MLLYLLECILMKMGRPAICVRHFSVDLYVHRESGFILSDD